MRSQIDCPHCGTVMAYNPQGTIFSDTFDSRAVVADVDGVIGGEFQRSPCCGRFVFYIVDDKNRRYLAWPCQTAIQPMSDAIPPSYAGDFQEAAAVLSISPKASAALSRRCLQHVLIGEFGVRERDTLAAQIRAVTTRTPALFHPRLCEKLDHVRIVGNFAAHPKKDTNTGEIIDIEPDEADYLLQVLAEVFHYHFIEGRQHAERMAAINRKDLAAN